MALTQCEQYEPFWRKHRDDWRPVTPDDIHGLREDRTFQPPSKAHVKRLLRDRPAITPLRPRPPVNDQRRREIVQAQGYGLAIRRMLMPNTTAPAKPMPYVRPAPIVPGAPRVAADHAERRAAQIMAECARIASYGSAELGRAWRLFNII